MKHVARNINGIYVEYIQDNSTDDSVYDVQNEAMKYVNVVRDRNKTTSQPASHTES